MMNSLTKLVNNMTPRIVHQGLPSSCPQLWASLQVWSIPNFDVIGWVKKNTHRVESPSVDALIRLPAKIMEQPAPSLEY